MRKLLWIGDAVVATGFARITHHVLNVLKESWDVSVLGLNYLGDPHPYPYQVFPCWPGGDAFGLGRVKRILAGVQPDLIVIQNDPWNIPEYLQQIGDACPVVAAMAVDGMNCRAEEYGLNKLALSIFWTKFGEDQARKGGLTGRSAVIPLGVDTKLYRPIDRLEARKALEFPEYMHDAFVVGNVNRNQPRKRLDLSIQAFVQWAKNYDIKDAYLYLQLSPTGDLGYDIKQLKHYFDPEKKTKMILIEPNIGHGVNESLLPMVYSAMDIQFSTTQGEGWGLTTMEGMACGIPQIIPNWSALGEWTENAAIGVKCPTMAVTPNKSNVIGGVPDIPEVVRALNHLYVNKARREEFSRRGLALVRQPQFQWEAIGRAYADVLDTIELKEKAA